VECPACATENLPGSDLCEDCGSSLTNIEDVSGETDAIAEVLKNTKISSLESGKPVFAKLGESIDECVRKMQDAEVAHVLVTNDDGDLLGIVTERDILYKVTPTNNGETTGAIETIMTPDPHALTGDDSISVLLNTMAVYGYRRVPVKLDEGFAMVTVRQLFNHLLSLKTSKS
jgi:CBS domain-containing protein